jgi:hypothetical protein
MPRRHYGSLDELKEAAVQALKALGGVEFLRVLPHSSTPAILVSSEGAILRETMLRMRLWTR